MWGIKIASDQGGLYAIWYFRPYLKLRLQSEYCLTTNLYEMNVNKILVSCILPLHVYSHCYKLIFRLVFSPYQKAIEDMAAQKYANIVKLCSKEIADTTSPNLAKAYLLRATFYHLRGAGHDASEDLKQLMLLKNVDTRVGPRTCLF